MRKATARAHSPNKRKGRASETRPFQNLSNNSNIADITASARIQYLAARYGLAGSYAALIASLAFGGAHAG